MVYLFIYERITMIVTRSETQSTEEVREHLYQVEYRIVLFLSERN